MSLYDLLDDDDEDGVGNIVQERYDEERLAVDVNPAVEEQHNRGRTTMPAASVRILKPAGGGGSVAKSLLYGDSAGPMRPIANQIRNISKHNALRVQNHLVTSASCADSPPRGPFARVYRKRVFRAFQECRASSPKCETFRRILSKRQWRVHSEIADQLVAACDEGDGTMSRSSLVRAIRYMDSEWKRSRSEQKKKATVGNKSPTIQMQRVKRENELANKSPIGTKLRNAGLAELKGVTDEMRKKRHEAQLEFQRSLAAQILEKKMRKERQEKQAAIVATVAEDVRNRVDEDAGRDLDDESDAYEEPSRGDVAPVVEKEVPSYDGVGNDDALMSLYRRLQHDHMELKMQFLTQQEQMKSLLAAERSKGEAVNVVDPSDPPSNDNRRRSRLARAGREASRLSKNNERRRRSSASTQSIVSDPRRHPFWQRIVRFYEEHNPSFASDEKMQKLMKRYPAPADRAVLLSALEKKYGVGVPPPKCARKRHARALTSEQRLQRAAAARSERRRISNRKREEQKERRKHRILERYAQKHRRSGTKPQHISPGESPYSSPPPREPFEGGLETMAPLDAHSEFLPVPY